jgi:hypothetical protein
LCKYFPHRKFVLSLQHIIFTGLKKANMTVKAKNDSYIRIRINSEEKEKLKKFLSSQGQSLTAFIKKSVSEVNESNNRQRAVAQ